MTITGPSDGSARGASLTTFFARRRVPLGFASALAALALARPTGASLAAGCAVACLGEALRIWAAGHLEKSREVTRSGPYRYLRHPLYAGSAVMGLGVVIASRSVIVAVVVLLYLGITFSAAIRNEEAFLRRNFRSEYDAYTAGTADAVERPFSLARAIRNREYRAVAGLAIVVGVLWLKMAFAP